MLKEKDGLVYIDEECTYPIFRKVMNCYFLNVKIRKVLLNGGIYVLPFDVSLLRRSKRADAPYLLLLSKAIDESIKDGKVFLGGYDLSPKLTDTDFMKKCIEKAKPALLPDFVGSMTRQIIDSANECLQDLKGMNDLLVTLLMEEAFLNTEP